MVLESCTGVVEFEVCFSASGRTHQRVCPVSTSAFSMFSIEHNSRSPGGICVALMRSRQACEDSGTLGSYYSLPFSIRVLSVCDEVVQVVVVVVVVIKLLTQA